MTNQDELVEALSRYLTEYTGQRQPVHELRRISDGWESDVYAFDAPAWSPSGQVLRLYFGAQAGPTALHEYRSLELLARAGYPVPRVDLVEPDAAALGRPFLIMERVGGVSLMQRWRNPDPTVRTQAMEQFCSLLATLHGLEWAHLPGAEKVPTFAIAQQLLMWRRHLSSNPIPAFEKAMAWLEAASNEVKPQSLGVVHWDFHPDNILVSEVGRAWVIDWTQFQATDVRFDLAWTLVLLASHQDLATAQSVRSRYAEVRGWDEAAIHEEMAFFEAAACAKRLLSVLISIQRGADALGMRPGAEAIMSRQLPRIAAVYRLWLAITALPLPDVEELLAEHL